MWLDHAAVQHAVGPAIDGATAIAGDALPCPICRAAMRAWSAREVVLDRCDAHGVWFDRAELDALVAHARAGAGSGGLAVAGGIAGGLALGVGAAQSEAQGTSGEDTFATSVDAVSVAMPVVDAAGELAAGAGEVVVAGAEATGGVLEGIGEAVGAIFDWFS